MPSLSRRDDNLLRRCAGPAVAIVLLVILAATLTPFRLQARPELLAGGPAALLRVFVGGPSGLDDLLNNLLLFLPLGVALGLWLRPLLPRALPRLIAATLLGASLSFAIELSQLFVPGRSASLADLIANSAGTALGATSLWLADCWAASRRRLAAGMLTYLTLILAAAAQLQTAASLQSWDPSYKLLVGNEHNGLHPWAGAVGDLRLAAVALEPGEARALLRGEPAPRFDAGLLFVYPLGQITADDPPDLQPVRCKLQECPALAWRDPRPGLPGGPYLRSEAPMSEAVEAIRAADAFTLVATITPAATDQYGPARIVSLSLNNSLRNLTLGQEGDDLVVRLRTASNGPNGVLQQLRAPGLLASGEPRQVAVSYGGARLSLYAAGLDSPVRLEILPEAAALRWLAPGEAGRQVLALPPAAVVGGGWLLVHGLIGLPLGAGVAWWAAGVARRPRPWIPAAVAALLLPVVVELLLAAAGGRAMRPMNIGAEATFALGAFGLFGARAGLLGATRRAATLEVPRCR